MKTLTSKYLFSVGAAFGVLACIGLLGIHQAHAHGVAKKYSSMAPTKQYMMNRKAEISLARSAAPASISQFATVLVLGPHGYKTAIKGTNGFVCMVSRSWLAAFDWPEFWNPKIRAAECLNSKAVRAILPLVEMRTKLAIAGDSKADILSKISEALKRGEVPALQAGAMSYMMSKESYLTDYLAGKGGHDLSHVMFYVPNTPTGTWGANKPDSPLQGVSYWFISKKTRLDYKNLPKITVFICPTTTWSDGTPIQAN